MGFTCLSSRDDAHRGQPQLTSPRSELGSHRVRRGSSATSPRSAPLQDDQNPTDIVVRNPLIPNPLQRDLPHLLKIPTSDLVGSRSRLANAVSSSGYPQHQHAQLHLHRTEGDRTDIELVRSPFSNAPGDQERFCTSRAAAPLLPSGWMSIRLTFDIPMAQGDFAFFAITHSSAGRAPEQQQLHISFTQIAISIVHHSI